MEIIYRIYEIDEYERKRYDGEIDIVKSKVMLDQNVLCCNDRTHFKEIMKDLYQPNEVHFANTKKLKQGDIYINIISENCYNTEIYLMTNDYKCTNCGRNFKSNERFLKKINRTYFLKNTCEQLYKEKEKEIDDMVFCCEKCREKKEDELEKEFKEFVKANDPMGETWINRDDFKEFENGFIYKITKKSTSEFYVGQTKYVPIFRWGEHLKTNRFPLENIFDYKFETLEIVSRDKLFEREAYWINKCRNENPELSLNIQIPKEKTTNIFDFIDE